MNILVYNTAFSFFPSVLLFKNRKAILCYIIFQGKVNALRYRIDSLRSGKMIGDGRRIATGFRRRRSNGAPE